MMLRFAAAFFLALTHAAAAQNCDNVKSGLDANRKPQNTARDIIGQSLDQIVERGWIMIAVYEDFAPYSYKEDGKLKGVDVEIGRHMAGELGVEARFLVRMADENVDADLRNNVWRGPLIGGRIANVMMHVPYDRALACRNEQVVFNGQYFNEKIAVAYATSEYPDGGPTPVYFRYDKVGVENDTLSDFYLTGLANGQVAPNVRRFPDYETAMSELGKGTVKAVMGPIGQLEHYLGDGIAIHQPPLLGLARSQWPLGVAVRHNWRPLSYAIDDIMTNAVGDGTMEAIFKRHGLSYSPPKW